MARIWVGLLSPSQSMRSRKWWVYLSAASCCYWPLTLLSDITFLPCLLSTETGCWEMQQPVLILAILRAIVFSSLVCYLRQPPPTDRQVPHLLVLPIHLQAGKYHDYGQLLVNLTVHPVTHSQLLLAFTHIHGQNWSRSH